MHTLTAAWLALGSALSRPLLGVISRWVGPNEFLGVALGILGNPLLALVSMAPLEFISGALARE